MDGFYMDEYEVSNDQYRKFIRVTGHRESIFWDNSGFNQPNQPVVSVRWNDAVAYVKWTSKRLLTEAEWEPGLTFESGVPTGMIRDTNKLTV